MLVYILVNLNWVMSENRNREGRVTGNSSICRNMPMACQPSYSVIQTATDRSDASYIVAIGVNIVSCAYAI